MTMIGPGVTNCSVQTYDKDGPTFDEDQWLQERLDQALSDADEVTTVTLVGPSGSTSALVTRQKGGLFVQFRSKDDKVS